MKKILATLLIITIVLSLAACGNTAKDTSDTGEDTADRQTPVDTGDDGTASNEDAAPSGTEYDVGDFSVFVPDGWEAIPQQDPDDPASPSTSKIRIVRGAVYDEERKAWNLSGLPYVEISLFKGDDLDKVPGDKSQWDSTEDAEDVTIGSFTWQGFTYEYFGMSGSVIWTASDERGYRVTVSYFGAIDLTDADVQAIIESLK